MCIAQDIETGDTLKVEINQTVEDMILVGFSSSQTIILLDKRGIKRTFKAKTLEGWGGPGYILGKSPNQIKLSHYKKSV
jgi:hypothetical protein